MPVSVAKVTARYPKGLRTLRAGRTDDGSQYDADAVEFMLAMDRYKRVARRPYPTAADVLAVARSLGYRKVGDQAKTNSKPLSS
jgi:hypothetical protein